MRTASSATSPLTTPLTFEPEAHIHRWRGAIVPGATQVLEDLQLSPRYPPDRGQMDFGKKVHHCCELFLRNRLESCGQLLLPYVTALEGVVRDYQIEPINTEMQVYHDRLGYAGILDLHCRIFGKDEAIIDYKTGVPPECVGLQTAAYDMALSRMLRVTDDPGKRRRRFALRLLTDETKTTGKAKLIEYTDAFDYQAFEGAVNVWKWKFGKNGNGRGKP